MITLRPHHLMCTSGYKGLNYNPESTNNWQKIITSIKNNPSIKVTITMKEDSFCKNCKHSSLNNNSCDKQFVKILDEKVKNLLGLNEGEKYCFQELKDKLCSIMTQEKHKEICQNCGW